MSFSPCFRANAKLAFQSTRNERLTLPESSASCKAELGTQKRLKTIGTPSTAPSLATAPQRKAATMARLLSITRLDGIMTTETAISVVLDATTMAAETTIERIIEEVEGEVEVEAGQIQLHLRLRGRRRSTRTARPISLLYQQLQLKLVRPVRA